MRLVLLHDLPQTFPDLKIANNERQDTIITSKAALKNVFQ